MWIVRLISIDLKRGGDLSTCARSIRDRWDFLGSWTSNTDWWCMSVIIKSGQRRERIWMDCEAVRELRPLTNRWMKGTILPSIAGDTRLTNTILTRRHSRPLAVNQVCQPLNGALTRSAFDQESIIRRVDARWATNKTGFHSPTTNACIYTGPDT